MTGSGSMDMVTPNRGGVSRPALTGRNQSIETTVQRYYIAFTISSTIFFASENSIMVLSRKNSSFSIPA